MSKILYAGDIHGSAADLQKILDYAFTSNVDAVVQVGDFGFFWPNDRTPAMDKFIAERINNWKIPVYTCGGNHDNWNFILEKERMLLSAGFPREAFEIIPGSGIFYVPRGSIVSIAGIKHLFIGGAESTDKEYRKPNISWWSDEEPNQDDFKLFAKNLNEEQPEVIISHDAPLRVPLFRVRRNQSYTPNMLEKVLRESKYQPDRWYFGHHHILEKWKINGTKFYCCGLQGKFWEYER